MREPDALPAEAVGPASTDQLTVAGERRAGSVGRSAVRGLRWVLVGNLVFKMGSFVVSLVMARLLAPEDFGLYAVALAANAFVIHVNDMGMIAATVQWRGEVRDMVATARTLAIGFSLTWYGLFWLAAPQLADLAGSAEATPLVRLLTLTVVIDGITAVSVGMIQRRFDLDKLMKSIAIGFAVGAVFTVTLAVNGAGAYSFVTGALVQSAVVAVLVMRIAPLPFRLGFDRAVARRLIAFGVPLAAALGIETALLFADSMIVGHVLGTVLLGYYLLAFNVSSWVPGLVGTAVRYVSIPAFSRLAEGSDTDLAQGVRKALPLLVGVVAPVAAAMFVLSEPMVQVLYGARWLAAADALQFLALVMVARMITSLAFDIQTGLGNTGKVVWVNLWWCACLVPSLWWGAHLDGIRGAAAAHAVVSFGVAIPLACWMLHRCGVDMVPVLRQLVRPVVAGVVAGLVMAGVSLTVQAALAQLILGGGAGLLVYLALALPARGRAMVRQRLLLARPSRQEVRA
jgi:O-antigen/teichoic acid export membrane protein